MLNLEVVRGAKIDRVIQGNDDFNAAGTGFLDSDALSATCWAGQSQTSIFAPTVSWSDSSLCQVALTVPASGSSQLDAGGVYQLQVFATREGQDPVCIAWVTLTCLPAAGSGTQTITTYCLDSDLLTYAPWLEDLLENTSDTEGFYNQRLRARQWLDRVIVSRARPLAYIFNIMTPLTPWGPVEAPNYIIQGYLQANYLLVRDSTIEIVGRKAIAHICEKQIDMDPDQLDTWMRRARHFHATANNRLSTYRAEMSMSSAPTCTVSDPTGAGAQVLAIVDWTTGVVSSIIPQQYGSGYTDPTFNFGGGTGNADGIVATPTVSGGLILGGTISDGSTGFYQKQTPDIAFNCGMISWR